ncbi:winged helix-turn-helix transcriptional regulator, partial [Megasphaera sp.]|uniref:winged helix-turn-helix transcriptional regulator n=1 Tax=Megasphaera sp. TaxID=2023260 RepID=UPI00307A15E7
FPNPFTLTTDYTANQLVNSHGSAGALTGKFHNRYHILLKEMEADGILYRKEYPQVPPKVEYGLTELGKSLMPILHEVCTWGQDHYVQR